MIPGEYFVGSKDIECNVGRVTVIVIVVNTGDRPVQVGSHFHFFEVNRQMEFDRSKAFGMRLNIAAGTAVRFEPGEEKEVELVAFGGRKNVFGFNNLANGNIDNDANKDEALKKLSLLKFKNKTP
ncbi:MAG: urease subunit beta [Ginsengibacter sp.]